MQIPRDRAFRRALSRFHRPWYRRLLPWGIVLFAVLAAGRATLGPLAERWSRATLAELQGFRGSYQRVDVFTFPPVYVVDGLRIESPTGDPVLSVERLELHADASEVIAAALWHRVPTVRVRVARPRVLLTGGTPVVLARELEAWAGAHLPQVNVELTKIEEGEILLGPEAGADSARLTTFMTGVNASAHREDPLQPLAVKGTAALLGSGETAFHLRLPLDEHAPMTGDMFLRYLALSDVYWMVERALPPGEAGRTLALAARFTLAGSDLQGTLRAASEHLGPADLPPELLERLRARLGGTAPWVIAERKPASDPNAVAVEGALSPAGAGRWLEALAAARALFAEGVGAASAAVPTSASLPAPSSVVAGGPAND
jgi:hypothetical protein